MRLRRVHQGHTALRDRALLAVMRLVQGHAPGVVRTLLYRKEFFGQPWGRLTHQVRDSYSHMQQCKLGVCPGRV